MTFVFLAEGFEEIEALTVVDILRRTGLDVTIVGVGGTCIKGAHGIPVVCDVHENLAVPASIDMVVIPGGMPGVENLGKSAVVKSFIRSAIEQDAYIAAICAGPALLGSMGLLHGKKAVCYPGFEEDLSGALVTDEYVQQDGKIITAKGPGVSMEFALKLAELLCNSSAASAKESFDEVREGLQCRK